MFSVVNPNRCVPSSAPAAARFDRHGGTVPPHYGRSHVARRVMAGCSPPAPLGRLLVGALAWWREQEATFSVQTRSPAGSLRSPGAFTGDRAVGRAVSQLN